MNTKNKIKYWTRAGMTTILLGGSLVFGGLGHYHFTNSKELELVSRVNEIERELDQYHSVKLKDIDSVRSLEHYGREIKAEKDSLESLGSYQKEKEIYDNKLNKTSYVLFGGLGTLLLSLLPFGIAARLEYLRNKEERIIKRLVKTSK